MNNFNGLCQMAEHGLLDIRIDALGATIRDLVSAARIFQFPGRAHEVLSKIDFEGDNQKLVQDMFFLPFNVVAVVDSASVVILADLEPDALGINQKRFWLDCQLIDPGAEAELGASCADDQFPAHLKGYMVVNWGTFLNVSFEHIRSDNQPTGKGSRFLRWIGWPWFGQSRSEAPEQPEVENKRWRLNANILGSGSLAAKRLNRYEAKQLGGRKGHWRVMHRFYGNELRNQCVLSGRNALVAMQELAVFNLPKRFLVEKTRVKGKKQKPPHPQRVLRYDERPVYVMMEPRMFRDSIGSTETQHENGQRSTHERRAHVRILRNARYRKKWTRVRATIIGPREGTSQDGRFCFRIVDAVPQQS